MSSRSTGSEAGLTAFEPREVAFAEHVEGLGKDELVALCQECHPAYARHTAPAVARMRGWVLRALSRGEQLPAAALPFVLEELETAHDPYLTAVAAVALRAWPTPVAAFARALHPALRFARHNGQRVSLSEYGGLGGEVSPLREVLAAVAHLGPLEPGPLADELRTMSEQRLIPAPFDSTIERNLPSRRGGDLDECCHPDGVPGWKHWPVRERRSTKHLETIVFETQNGDRRTYRELFDGHPSIVAFFYTRCENPLKCSATIWRLGRVRKLLAGRGDVIRMVGISYDADYDTPQRLLRYAANRGFDTSGEDTLVRVTEGFDVLRDSWKLGVSFHESIVTRQRVELFLLDAGGKVAATFPRLLQTEAELARQALALIEPEGLPWVGAAAALVPKCPVCWATYVSWAGGSGLIAATSAPVLRAAAAVFLLLHVALILRRRSQTGWRLAHALSLSGVALLAANLAWPATALVAAGATLTLGAALLKVRAVSARA